MYFAKTWGRWGKMLLLWTLATAIGGGVTYLIALGVGYVAGNTQPLFLWVGVPLGAAVGGVTAGIEQQRLLQTWLDMSSRWVWATALGWMISVPGLVAISNWFSTVTRDMRDSSAILTFLGGAALAGLVAALGQWHLLRGKVSRVNWWLLASAIGWAVAWVTTLGIAWLIRQDTPLPNTLDDMGFALLIGGIAGAIIGFETGVALIGLLAQAEWEARQTNKETL